MRYGHNIIDVHVDVELNQIIDSIIGNSDAQEIVEFIQEVEKEFGDIDVTRQLYNHFKNEMNIEDKDSKIQTSLLNCEEDYISTMYDLERKYGTSYIEKIESPQEVLQWYLDLNDGGVVHTQDELNKVRMLLNEENKDD